MTTINDSVIFPTNISFGSTHIRGDKQNRVFTAASGKRYVVVRKARSARSFNVAPGIKKYEHLRLIEEIYESHGHDEVGFLYKDWLDYKSCADRNGTPAHTDQLLGEGNGSLKTFQLRKGYTQGGRTYYHPIFKPKVGSVKIGRNGVNLTTGWSVDTSTGVVTFTSAPTAGSIITAGYEYYVPVVFENTELELSMDHYEHGLLTDIVLKEITQL